LSRGWEDFWGRVRRIQYPTFLDVRTEDTPYKSPSEWTTIRKFEKDLEFNIPTRWLQLRIVGTVCGHVYKAGVEGTARLGYRVLWNQKELVGWTDLAWVILLDTDAECTFRTDTGDIKRLIDLGADEVRGKLAVEFGTYVDRPAYHEVRITGLNKAEVGVYEW